MCKLFHSVVIPACSEAELDAKALALMGAIDVHYSGKKINKRSETFSELIDAEELLEDELCAWSALGAVKVTDPRVVHKGDDYAWVVGGWTVDNTDWIERHKAKSVS